MFRLKSAREKRVTTAALEQLMSVAEALVWSVRVTVKLGVALEAAHSLLEDSDVLTSHGVQSCLTIIERTSRSLFNVERFPRQLPHN